MSVRIVFLMECLYDFSVGFGRPPVSLTTRNARQLGASRNTQRKMAVSVYRFQADQSTHYRSDYVRRCAQETKAWQNEALKKDPDSD